MDNTMILLGRRIRNLRKDRGMTQEELAVVSDIGVKYLSRIERGDTNVTLKLLSQLADALEIEMCELLQIKQEQARAYLEEELCALIRNSREEKLRFLYRIATLI